MPRVPFLFRFVWPSPPAPGPSRGAAWCVAPVRAALGATAVGCRAPGTRRAQDGAPGTGPEGTIATPARPFQIAPRDGPRGAGRARVRFPSGRLGAPWTSSKEGFSKAGRPAPRPDHALHDEPCPGLDAGDLGTALEDEQQAPGAVAQHALEVLGAGAGLDPHRLDPPRHPDPLARHDGGDRAWPLPAALGQGLVGGQHGDLGPAGAVAPALAVVAVVAVVAGPPFRRRGSVPTGRLGQMGLLARSGRRSGPARSGGSGRLNGMMVALTWGTWLRTAASLSAVRSCRKRCHPPPIAAPGQQHRALGVAVDRGVRHELDRGPQQAPVGALDDVEGNPGQTDPGPVLLEQPCLLRVDVEVDGAHVVGGERARGTGGPAPSPCRGGPRGRPPHGGAGAVPPTPRPRPTRAPPPRAGTARACGSARSTGAAPRPR